MSRFMSVADLASLPPPRWLIQDMFEVGSLVMIAGPAASYKSFLALDWSLCMASSKDWCDKPTTPSKVLYVLGEGKSNVLKRIDSWGIYHNIRDTSSINDNFRITFDVPQMANKPDVDKLLRDLHREDYEPEVVIIDTLARSFVGKNENDQLDTGLWIESADRLRQLGMTVIFLHHTAKNTEFGLRYRGSTTLIGAMDTAYTMQRDSEDKTLVILNCTKQKDHDEGPPLYFRRNIVQGSIVLVPEDKHRPVSREDKAVEESKIDSLIADLLANTEFESDRARARELAAALGKNEGWAQTRIVRTRALKQE